MTRLENDNAVAILDPAQGGRLTSLQVHGHELLVSSGEDPLSWGCYPMLPWAGRLRHGGFCHHGRQYRLPLTFPPHAIHGTAWNRPWHLIGANEMGISLGRDWPFSGSAIHRFSLSADALHLRLEVHAEEQAFPVSVGWHPWFRRQLDTGSTAHLDFDAEAVYELDTERIPTGNLLPPGPGPWDDCFTEMKKNPVITWPGVISLHLDASTDHWVVYDQPAHAICVEPMSGPPDALNCKPRIVTPWQPFRADFTLSWQIHDRR